MSSVNFATKEIGVRIVYYGPGLGGKSTSLQHLYRVIGKDHRGELMSLATGEDRTIFFDFMPLNLQSLHGFSVRLYLYTVPGQVHYNATRKLVLTGVDGVVLVADSQPVRAEANVESMSNLSDNLSEQGIDIAEVPIVLQFNKRDLAGVLTVDEMNAQLNPDKRIPWFETTATSGHNLVDALKMISRLTLTKLQKTGVFAYGPRTDLTPPSSTFQAAGPDSIGARVANFVESLRAPASTAREEPLLAAEQRLSMASGEEPRDTREDDEAPGAPLSFVSLWVEPRTRMGVEDVERALYERNARHAMMILGLLLEATIREDVLPPVAEGLPEPGRVQLLGLDNRDYLRFRTLTARAAVAEDLPFREVLFAYHFVIAAQLRVAELKRS